MNRIIESLALNELPWWYDYVIMMAGKKTVGITTTEAPKGIMVAQPLGKFSRYRRMKYHAVLYNVFHANKRRQVAWKLVYR